MQPHAHTNDTLAAELSQFTGSEHMHRHWTGRLYFTDGIHHLADRAGAFWLAND